MNVCTYVFDGNSQRSLCVHIIKDSKREFTMNKAFEVIMVRVSIHGVFIQFFIYY